MKPKDVKFDEFRFTLGCKLRLIRECHNYTLKQMADRLGTTGPTVANYESGKETANLLYLIEIAKFGGVTLEDLAYMSKTDFMVKLLSVR